MEIQIRGPFATGRTQPVIPIPDMIHIPLFCGIQPIFWVRSPLCGRMPEISSIPD